MTASGIEFDTTIEYANGARVFVTNETDAVVTLHVYYPNMVRTDWEPAGEGRERQLVWQKRSEQINDDGSRAIAQIIRITK